ncbi:MAG: hypothetical protein LBU17_03730 [Treponema sp.]|jgi:hypothetical protein|nr:hypothetical protein [Treponema sp.]
MMRLELMANHSVEENILDAFRDEGVGKFYTKYPTVFGVGSAGPHMGDAIWPEENFSLVVWCEEEEARGIERAIAAVKQRFPDEGIKLFCLREAPPVKVPAPVSVPLSTAGASAGTLPDTIGGAPAGIVPDPIWGASAGTLPDTIGGPPTGIVPLTPAPGTLPSIPAPALLPMPTVGQGAPDPLGTAPYRVPPAVPGMEAENS